MPKGKKTLDCIDDEILKDLAAGLSQRKVLQNLQSKGICSSKGHVHAVALRIQKKGSMLPNPPVRSGRPPLLSARADRRLLWFSAHNPHGSAREARRILQFNASVRTVQRHMVQPEVKTCKEVRYVKQEEGDAGKRVQWTSAYLIRYSTKDFVLVFACDEKYFSCDGPTATRIVHWCARFPKPMKETRKFGGGGVHVWIGISKEGLSEPVFKDSAFNQDDIGRAIDNALPEIEAVYILDDNYRPHRTEDVQMLAMDLGCTHLVPPARSPDINFAEQALAFVSQKVYKGGKTYANPKELEQAISNAVSKANKSGESKELFMKLINRWPANLQWILNHGGSPHPKWHKS